MKDPLSKSSFMFFHITLKKDNSPILSYTGKQKKKAFEARPQNYRNTNP